MYVRFSNSPRPRTSVYSLGQKLNCTCPGHMFVRNLKPLLRSDLTPFKGTLKLSTKVWSHQVGAGHNLESRVSWRRNKFRSVLTITFTLHTDQVSRWKGLDHVFIFFTGFMADRLHTYVPSFILAAATEFAAASLLLILICGKRHTRNPEPLNSGEDHNFEHSTCIWETNV